MGGEWERKSIDVDGVAAHYLEAGDGDEALLLIHGGIVWCSAEITYGAVLPHLARRLRVIAVDVIGFGETPGRGPEDYSQANQGAFLLRFLQRLGLRAHVGGNSAGGWLAMYLALEAPNLVKTLTIINSGSTVLSERRDDTEDRYDPRWAVPPRPPTPEDVREELLAFYHQKHIVSEARITRTQELALRHYNFAVARQRTTGLDSEMRNRNLQHRGKPMSELAGELALPVLLTWSRENRGARIDQALPFFNKLRNGEMHVFLNAGHHVQLEHPERWSSVVTDFVMSYR